MPTVNQISSAEIAKSGIILVQKHLLARGIQSTIMTNHAGIDLLAYFPHRDEPVTIQVTSNLQPKAAGGRGRMALDWRINEKCAADYATLVDLEAQRIWLIPQYELAMVAQQKASGRLHVYFYTDPRAAPRLPGRRAQDFDPYLIERQLEKLMVPSNEKNL